MESSDEELKSWLASYAGVDGGNPNADVWICGIEHGGDCEPLDEPLIPELSPGEWCAKYKKDHPDYTKWQYNQKVAKLIVAIQGWRSQGQVASDIPGWREYLRDKLYIRGGDTFKLNLFPLASRGVKSAEWKEAYGKILALQNKDRYYDLCRTGGRFGFFKKIRNEHAPEIIVGTSIEFAKYFEEAFGFTESPKPFDLVDEKGRRRSCSRYTDGPSTLIVTPFFGGRYGVNSNGLLIDLARRIAQKDWE